MRLDSPLRVYVDEDGETVRVACDMKLSPLLRGCYHLNLVDGQLSWVRHPEGDFVEPIPVKSFAEWLRRGEAARSARGLIADPEATISPTVH